MAPTPPTSEPAILYVGTDWDWDRTHSEAPPSEGYTLNYELRGESSIPTITATTSAAGDYYEVRVPKANTAGFEPGTYILIGRIEKDTETLPPIYERAVDLRPDPSSLIPALSFDEKLLAQIDTALLTLAASPYSSTQVAGQKVEFKDKGPLTKWQGELREKIGRARRQGRNQRYKVHNVPVS